MYSHQKIPAPFGQPCQNGRTEKHAADVPVSPVFSAETETALPITAEEKAVSKAAAYSSSLSSPLLAFLLFDLFSNQER